ncbi:MAG TPA: hypothetical protein VG963_13490, partial [Polyangiaceae bacterium]|nr:hypothetical protein [Polyangiaceae bacterium]
RALEESNPGGLTAARSDAALLIERFPEALRRHVAMRLAAPEIAAQDAAREVLADNLSKLARLHQRRERASVVEELRRASASGDHDAQMKLLEQQLARARARHGLS